MTLKYCLIQLFYWVCHGNAYSFASVYLTEKSFSSTLIGAIGSVACALSIVLQPRISAWADRSRGRVLKKLCIALCVPAAVCSALLRFLPVESTVYTAALYGTEMLMMTLLMPFVSALAMESARRGRKVNFGLARGIGSAGYAVLTFTLGTLIERAGIAIQQTVMLGMSLLLLLSIALFPYKSDPDTLPEAENAPAQGTGKGFLRRYPRFAVTLGGCALLYISHVFLNSFFYQIILSKGMGTGEMGIAMAIASLSEIPTMVLFALMLKKMRCGSWMRVAGVFFTLKILGTLLVSRVLPFYAVMLFQMLGYGLLSVAGIAYSDFVTRDGDHIRGQAWFSMTCSVGTVIGSFTGGFLIDAAGVNGMLITGTVLSALGAAIVALSAQNERKTA